MPNIKQVLYEETTNQNRKLKTDKDKDKGNNMVLLFKL